MWDWLRRLRARAAKTRKVKRAQRMTRWLKAHPDRIRIDARRIKEWSRNRGH